MTNETDPDVRAALEGDKEALERLVEKVQPLVYRLALRFFGNTADAEDASQEALIQIVTRLDRFSGRSAFTSRRRAAARSRRPTWTPSCSPRRSGSAARLRCFSASIRATGWPSSSARSWGSTT
jgi:Sigma-70 region 2